MDNGPVDKMADLRKITGARTRERSMAFAARGISPAKLRPATLGANTRRGTVAHVRLHLVCRARLQRCNCRSLRAVDNLPEQRSGLFIRVFRSYSAAQRGLDGRGANAHTAIHPHGLRRKDVRVHERLCS